MDLAGLYRAHGPAILARCRRFLGDDASAERLAPRLFLRVHDQLTGDPQRDEPLLDRTLVELSSELPGPRLLRDPGPPSADELRRAHERFTREVYRRTLPPVERDERPPLVLRFLWIYAPIFVALAMTGMFLAVRAPVRPERPGAGARAASLEVYGVRDGVTRRLLTGMSAEPGERLRVVVAPAGFTYVTVTAGPRVHQRLGPLSRDQGPVEVPPLVVDQRPMRIGALFARSPRGLPVTERSVELPVHEPYGSAGRLPSRVSAPR